MGIHDGHRERLRKTAQEGGIESLSEVQALELLLSYALPRVDTNVTAHRLLDRFHSFTGVLDADAAELMQVDGIGERAAFLLRSIPGFLSRYEAGRVKTGNKLNSPELLAEFLRPKFLDKPAECFSVVCMDTKGALLSFRFLSQGEVNSVEVSPRRVVEEAIKCKASMVAIAHNHPAGSPEPSREDRMATERVKTALETVSIKLVDHIILLGGGGYTSFCEEDLL